MSKTIFVLNGPNLNLLGKREPGIYGSLTLDEIGSNCEAFAKNLGFDVDFRQSNHEGVFVDWLQEAEDNACGIVFNPAAYTHTSMALHDACRSISKPVIEIHLTNPHTREAIRHKSFISPTAKGVICGFGSSSYTLAIHALADICNS